MSDSDIILIDDEADVLAAYRQTLELEGFAVEGATSVDPILVSITRSWPGVIVTDVRMPRTDGFAFLESVRSTDPDIPVILVTGHGDIAMAMRAVRAGAYDFIEKPAAPEHLIEVVRRAGEHRRLVLENRRLREALDGLSPMEARLIGRSAVMERLRATLGDLAGTDADVLVFGETGTGKELVARCLHDCGPRRAGNFVAINCGALPEAILESELFGHEEGAFTGTRGRRIGKLEHANGGTLFLDEIESMPLAAQIRLLRVLQERVVERLGSNREIPIDIRVVAATKADLRALADEGRFRADLYYRLDVVTVRLPPLRERREDIPLLFHHFADMAAKRHRRPPPRLDPALLARLRAESWPGNVRELRNAAERAVLGLAETPPAGGAQGADDALTLAEQVDRFERQVIEAALSQCGGRIGDTAARLGLIRKTLYLKMRKYGLERSDFQGG